MSDELEQETHEETVDHVEAETPSETPEPQNAGQDTHTETPEYNGATQVISCSRNGKVFTATVPADNDPAYTAIVIANRYQDEDIGTHHFDLYGFDVVVTTE